MNTDSIKQIENLEHGLLEPSERVVAAPGQQESLKTLPERLDGIEMRAVGWQVAQEDVSLFPNSTLLFQLSAGMESCVVEHHHGYTLGAGVLRQRLDEGNDLFADDAAFYDIEMQSLIGPGKRSYEVESAVTAPATRHSQSVATAALAPGVGHGQGQ